MSRADLASKFELVFRRLLAREEVDLYAEDMSLMWEAVAGTLFGNLPERKYCYFDGVINLVARLKTPRQVEFIKPPDAKDTAAPRAGMAPAANGQFYDPWGKPYIASADEGQSWQQIAAHLPDVLCVRAAVV